MPRIKNPRPPEPEAQHLRVNTFSKVHAIPRPTLYLMMRRGELNYIDTGHGRILPARLEDALKATGA